MKMRGNQDRLDSNLRTASRFWRVIAIAIVIGWMTAAGSVNAQPAAVTKTFYVDAAAQAGSGDGTEDLPYASLIEARDGLRRWRADRKTGEGAVDAAVVVRVAAGRYPIGETLTLDRRDGGTADAPVIYRGTRDGGGVILDGSRPIDRNAFSPVDASQEFRLSPKAIGHVVVAKIDDADMVQSLRPDRRRRPMILQDGRLLTISRFPNLGFAHVDELYVADEATRWQMDPPTATYDEPLGAVFTIRETPAGTYQQWSTEIDSHRDGLCEGYLCSQWYRSSQPIASVTPEGQVQYVNQTRYGLTKMVTKFQSRLIVRHLLCEIDSPGEWYFDSKSHELYMWPLEPLDQTESLSLAAGRPAIELLGDHVTIEEMTIEGIAGGGRAVKINGNSNTVAGCVVRNCDVVAFDIDGRDNTVTGCDVYDVRSFASISGGRSHPDGIDDGNNSLENCHLTMDQWTGVAAGVSISGAGNRVANNLIHNLPGQAIVFRGNRQVIEQNELFNIGFEEGDGAAIYSGAEFWGYGSVIRHNFLHHIMSTEGLMTRSGIMLDDHDSGREVIGNLFYKSGHGSLAINGGTGLEIHDNVFIKGQYGVWVRVIGKVKERIAMAAKFESGELKRGDKHDYVWRTERVVGEEGWNRPFWKTNYPTFARVMNQDAEHDNLRFWPIENRVTGTVGYAMGEALTYRHPAVPEGALEFEHTHEMSDDEFATAFVDEATLDLRWAEPKKDWMPAIPFESIGLRKDRHRRRVPDKATYRAAVRKRFADRPSANWRAKYDFDHVNETIYYNSGRQVLGMTQ